jgi:hypothetical protein
MASICSNCKAELKCGCQKRIASDKHACCISCINQYEQSLRESGKGPVPAAGANTQGKAPVINNILFSKK